MATSRLDRIGTIFSRVNSLIAGKAMNWENRPIWYDVYKAFPPYEEPRFDRPEPNMPLKAIFYPEDEIRAKFHLRHKNLGVLDLAKVNQRTVTRRFIELYETQTKK